MNSYEAILKALQNISQKVDGFSLVQSEESTHGDYATNIAFLLSKKDLPTGEAGNKNPKEYAESILPKLKEELAETVEDIQIAGAGFINFFLKDNTRTKEAEIISKKDFFRKKDKGNVLVEYTDPNCFKVFHIGHLMSNAIGEAISRLYEAGGYNVTRVCYPSDIGRNVAMGVWGMMKKESEIPKEDATILEKVEFLGKCYTYANEQFEINEEAKKEILEINKVLYEKSDKNVLAFYEKGKAWSLTHFDELYKKLGTKFDSFIFESEVSEVGKKIVEEFVGKIFEESEGAIVYKGEQDGLHTRVFINALGLPTYEAKDLGNYKKKQEIVPKASSFITITANEQNEYFKVVNKVTEKILPELLGKLMHIGHGVLRLPTGKMSSRSGNVVGLDDMLHTVEEKLKEKVKNVHIEIENKENLITDIAIGAIKFSILRQAIGRDIIFDIDTSISFEGDSGPYLQYTHARICTLLDKAQKLGIGEKYKVENSEKELEQAIICYEQILEKAYEEIAPHHIVNHLLKLTRSFNAMYGNVQLLNENDKEKSAYYVMLAKATKNILSHGLHILGITAPERM